MGRPKTITFAMAEFSAEALRRFREKQKTDPTWQPTESQARVVKLLAEAEVILQKRKPVKGDEEESSSAGMSVEELEQSTIDKPTNPPAEAEDDA